MAYLPLVTKNLNDDWLKNLASKFEYFLQFTKLKRILFTYFRILILSYRILELHISNSLILIYCFLIISQLIYFHRYSVSKKISKPAKIFITGHMFEYIKILIIPSRSNKLFLLKNFFFSISTSQQICMLLLLMDQ